MVHLAIHCPESLGNVIEGEIVSELRWVLTPEGEEVGREGSHEARLFNLIPPEGIQQVTGTVRYGTFLLVIGTCTPYGSVPGLHFDAISFPFKFVVTVVKMLKFPPGPGSIGTW